MLLGEAAFQQIVWNIEHIGTPHCVSLKIIEKTSEKDYDAVDLAEIIGKDATVSAQVLKVANSIYFSRTVPCKTIHQAVVTLGSDNIKKLIFAIEMLGVFKAHCASEKFDETVFWKHSLAGAIIASKYGRTEFCTDQDMIYAAGLIRNIGVLALRQYLPGEFEMLLELMEANQSSFEECSRQFLGVSHRHIAYMIGLRWSLPRVLIEALDDRDNPFELSRESSETKKAIMFADDLLKATNFAVWDPYYTAGTVDFHGIPCEEIFTEASSTVEKMFKEFWT